MADQRYRRGIFEMIAAMVISGTIGWFVIRSGQNPVNVVFFRCLFGALSLSVICAFSGLLKWSSFTWSTFLLTLAGGLAIVGNWVLLFAAFQRASISIATAVYYTQPFMLVLMGGFFLREGVSIEKLVWLGIAFSGLLLVIQVEPGVVVIQGEFLTGIALSLGAAFLYAIASLITKRLTGIPPQLIAFMQVSLGAMLLFYMVDFSVLPQDEKGWSSLVALGVVHTGIMYILLYGAIQKLPTTSVASISFIYPAVAIFIDYLAFDQSLGWGQIVGVMLILAAAIATNLGWNPFDSMQKNKMTRTSK